MSKKINNCRNCKSKNLEKLFSLGKIRSTGKFPNKKQRIPFGDLTLIMCEDCKLVQLSKDFDLKYLYNKEYGYRTGINKTMTKHVESVAKILTKISKIKKNENVLDIASNDGTLLNFYDKKIIKWGIDPISKFKKYSLIDYRINNFFQQKKSKILTKKNLKLLLHFQYFMTQQIQINLLKMLIKFYQMMVFFY